MSLTGLSHIAGQNYYRVSQKNALSDLPSINRGLLIPNHQINWWLGMLASLKVRFFGTPCNVSENQSYFPFILFFFNTEWLDGNLSKLQPVHNQQTDRPDGWTAGLLHHSSSLCTPLHYVLTNVWVKTTKEFWCKGIPLFYQIVSETHHFWRLPQSLSVLPKVVDHIIRIVSLNLFIGWLNAVRRQKESCFESLITVTIRVTRGRTWKGKKDTTVLLTFIHMILNLIVLLVLVWNDLWQTNAWHQSCVSYWQYRWLYPSSWWHFKGERVTTRLFEQLSRMTRPTNHGLECNNIINIDITTNIIIIYVLSWKDVKGN